MNRRQFFSLFPFAITLSACRRVSDDTLFASAPKQNLLLTINPQIQRIAEQQISEKIRQSIAKRKGVGGLPEDTDCAFVCVENATGNILSYLPTAIPGSEYDTCRLSQRDIGSTAKPLIYAAALQMGAISANDTFPDEPLEFTRLDAPGSYTAQNYANHYTRTRLTIEDAIAFSSNSVALQVYHKTSRPALIELMQGLNLPTDCNINLMPLGRWPVPILKLATAFTVFPNQGQAVQARFIAARILSNGQTRQEPITRTANLFRSEVCQVISQAMHACVAHGSGASAADLALYVRGKTGSSTDALSVLQSKTVTTALWVGRRNSNKDLHITGGQISMPALARFFRELQKLRPDLVPSWS